MTADQALDRGDLLRRFCLPLAELFEDELEAG
jgi:hypothetical protein